MRARFSSAILPAWAWKSSQVAEVLPLLYLHGLSSGDFAAALEQFLGSGAAPDRNHLARAEPRILNVAARAVAFSVLWLTQFSRTQYHQRDQQTQTTRG